MKLVSHGMALYHQTARSGSTHLVVYTKSALARQSTPVPGLTREETGMKRCADPREPTLSKIGNVGITAMRQVDWICPLIEY